MVDSLNSTRQSSPVYQLKRPVQGIPLDDLLTTTAEDLLGSVVTTLRDHSQRYISHLDQQKLLFSSYVKTMAKSQVRTLSTKSVTKSCGKSVYCKQPAIFQGHSTQLDINRSLEQDAFDARKHASECFFTMVDFRVCTQTAVSLSRINSVVCHLSHPVISNIQHSALLDLAWSCLVFLWEHLKLIINYPPVKSFLREASEVLAPVISGNTTTMDRLLALFETDYCSIVFLCHVFQYNKQHHSMLIQQYQRMTLLIIAVQNAALSEKTPLSLSLSQYLPAFKYLIGSFDINTWTNSDTAIYETKRQAFYLAACDFIRQQDDWKQEYRDTDQNNNNGSIDGNDRNNLDNNNLVSVVISHMMTVMTTFLRKQKGSIQGEHLYVLHLLLDTLATTNSKHNISTTSDTGLTRTLDAFIEVISQQSTKTMIVTQYQWKQQNRPEMRLEWTLLNDPGHTLDVIHTIDSQVYTTTGTGTQRDSLKVYGLSGCMALARLIFALLLDPRVKWDFTLLVRYFELFWQPSRDSNDTIKSGQKLEQDEEETLVNDTTGAQLYITQLFGLSLDLLLSRQNNNSALQNVLNDLHHYFHQSLLYQLDDSWFSLFLPILTNLPWGHLSPLHSDTMETMLTSCIRLRKSDRPKYKVYSTFVYAVLQHTIMTGHQQHMTPLDHCRLLLYVELSFILLMTAEWIWPNEVIRLENLEKLWEPIINVSDELKADDMNLVVDVTRIDDPSNWTSSLERQEKNGNSDVSCDQDCLVICIRWMRHLTIVMGDTGSMKLVAVFGNFILAHITKVGNIGVEMDWLKVLLDQADGYMTKHDTTLDFDDCIDWFRVLIRTLLDEHQQHDNGTPTGIERVMDTICDAISTSDYSTTLAMFTACVPLKSSSTASFTSLTDSTEPLGSINFRLKVMECCLEHCLQLRHGEDVWLRVGVLLHDSYMGKKNQETTTKLVEASISEYIRHSMDLSFFLVLNAYCHAKLQQSYSVTEGENGTTINKDHHVAEEIAAILSMAQLGGGGGGEMMDIQQLKKRMVLVRLFARLLSKNKKQKSLDLWLASVVSMARSCARWSTLTNHTVSQSDKGQAYHNAAKDGSAKYHNHGWTTWKALVTALECFLASRLAIIGIPPYSGMIPKNNSDTKMTPWIAMLKQKKKKDTSHKELFDFTIGVIQDLDHWTIWELDEFILQVDGLSFGST